MPGLTYVTWPPRMLWPCVRNHATTMSVSQERMLAATSMTDIQSVNKQCCERSLTPTEFGDYSLRQILHGTAPEESAVYGDSAINDRICSIPDIEGLARRIVGPYEVGAIDGDVHNRFRQRTAVVRCRRWIVRLLHAVPHQGSRVTVGEPSIAMKLERIQVPALSAHSCDRTP
jgi:hypothetical protein